MEDWCIKFLRHWIIPSTKIVSFLDCYISWHSSGHIIWWFFSFNNTSSVVEKFLASFLKLISQFPIWRPWPRPPAVYGMDRNLLLVNIRPQDNLWAEDYKGGMARRRETREAIDWTVSFVALFIVNLYHNLIIKQTIDWTFTMAFGY